MFDQLISTSAEGAAFLEKQIALRCGSDEVFCTKNLHGGFRLNARLTEDDHRTNL
jgi:hypothetical protein